MCVLGESA
uniref:Uncharacterized protein n=1 Tax=Arundo donax TaxID=35708 RepID=A0A0A9EG64_ARUDO